MNWLGEFFNIIWQMYSIELPFLNGMTIGMFVIGVFVVLIGIQILRKML